MSEIVQATPGQPPLSDEAGFIPLLDKITSERGFRCSSYKDKCLRRRIAVRMRANKAFTYWEYSALLDRDPLEYDRLLRALTINVTKFFRNWETYATIEERVMPALWERSEPELRVWSAGCSSGEEPYSLAVLMHRQAAISGERSRLERAVLLGTDIDVDCLAEAERGFYGEPAFTDTPRALREEYFPQVAGLSTITPEVKRMVRFARHDVLEEAPPMRDVHLLVCRNVIIYFERDAQEKLLERFHRALAPAGFLVLGKVETLLGKARSLFSAVNARERIFRKL